MDKTTARDYIRSNFHEDDRLAIVLIQKSTGAVTQRIADVDRITSDQFQAWLRYMNSRKHEVYVSMNALNPDAGGRTKADVAAVRHIYLDFDKDGPEAIRAIRERKDLPPPNHILQSSPGKFQVVWKAEGFEKQDAESLMRGLVRELGADPAATDSARVLRVPGFFYRKQKYMNEGGLFPFVRLIEASGTSYSEGERFVSALSAEIESEVRSRESRRRESPFPRRQAIKGIDEFRSNPQYGGDATREDLAFAIYALSNGSTTDNVAATLRSRDLSHKGDEKRQNQYVDRTIAKALTVKESKCRG